VISKRRLLLGGLAATGLQGVQGLLATAAQAQGAGYPNRPVRLIVPVAAGGGTDLMARTVSQKLSERLGQPVIIENRVGGGGVVAMEYVAKSPADGYTLVMGFPGPLAVNQFVYKNLAYDGIRDFVPVSLLAGTPRILVAHPSVPANTIRELVAVLRKEPGRFNYGSGGNTTTGHLVMELFKSMTQTDVVHVAYKGAGPMLTDLLTGRVQLAFETLALTGQHIKAGKLKVLGISTARRYSLAPEIPTIAESGVAGFDITGWYGIVAPAGTPQPIVTRLAQELNAIMDDPAMRAQLAARDLEPIGKGSEEFARFLAAEAKKWGALVKERNITAD
jgi:tripartite-type tricarboxylate transporter receptor subunit TctC